MVVDSLSLGVPSAYDDLHGVDHLVPLSSQIRQAGGNGRPDVLVVADPPINVFTILNFVIL